jgi:hypothetical protein
MEPETMTKRLSAIAIYAVLFLAAFLPMPAGAQFADQATLLTSVGGTNSVTATIAPSLTSYGQVKGVLLKLIPGNSNTSAATLTLNSLGSSPAIEKMTPSGLAALTGNGCELVTGMPSLLMYDGTEFVLLTTGCSVVSAGSSNLANSALAFTVPTNLQINASVGSNQLTLSVVGNNGSAASATNPILVAFRDVTIANGDPVIVSLQAALSFTIASGSTMGCVSGLMCRLRVYLVNNGGTLGLCAYNSVSGTGISGLNEQNLQSSPSSTSGGNSAQQLYCSIASISTKAVREIGYVDVQETTAGTWASTPTYTQLMGPGVLKAGATVQSFFASISSELTTSNTYAASNTAPAPANGAVAIAAPTLTPSSLANVIRVTGQAVIGNSSGTTSLYAYLYNGSATVSTAVTTNAAINTFVTVPFAYQTIGLTATTYTLYFAGGAGTTYLNSNAASTPLFNGTASTWILVEEKSAELEPANDNAPLSMVG